MTVLQMQKDKPPEAARLALYRKWRSRNFGEIVGQHHVVKTLKNALASGRVASAYLFSGPRGTGKTSMARILAKAINCLQPADGEPCNKCRNCQGINSGSFLDVIEMDAASHTQVEKIREFIVEKVNFRPTEGKKKVYIIDEVHKLSAYSFDALLKTIEEPPPFVVFILATTEPDKLPPTILSRCQRFDFKRISVKLIVERLKEICDKEKFDIEEGALSLIAQSSDGALRDALVVLEQAFSFSDGIVRPGDVVSLLGITGAENMFSFADAILEKNTAKGIEFINEIYNDGKDLTRLTVDLLEHFRRLLIVQLVRESQEMLEISGDMHARLQEQTLKFKRAHLLHIISELVELRKNLKETGLDRILWEMAVVRLTSWEILPSLEALNRKISDLEKRLSGAKIEDSPQAQFQIPRGKIHGTKPTPPPDADFAPETQEIDLSKISLEKRESGATPLTEINDDAGLWHRILREIKKEKFNLIPILQEVGAGKKNPNEYILKIDPRASFNRNIIEKHRKYIEEVLFRLTGENLKLAFENEKSERLFDEEKKPHRVFVDEVGDIFGATSI